MSPNAPTSPPDPLKGLSRWVTGPSTVGGLAGAALAVVYGIATLALPEGTYGWFLGIVAVVAVAATVRGDAQEQRALSVLADLGRGALAPVPENLRRGVAQAFAFPDRAFWINFQNWVGGSLVIGLAYAVVPTVTWPVAIRVTVLGVVFGPITSMLTHLLVARRCRRAAERLASVGLSVHEVLESAPPGRLELRRRLMLFTAISVLTPTVLIADVSFRHAERTLSRVLAEGSQEAQLRTLEAEQSAGAAPLVALAAMVIGVVICTGYIIGSALGGPMRAIADEATRIASGDLKGARIIPAEDEVWAASAAFTTMQMQLSEALSRLKQAGIKISTATEQLVATSAKHEEGALEQTSALTETSATTEELARSARQIAGNALEVANLAEETLGAAQQGMRSTEAFVLSMGRMRDANQAIADSVVKLNKRVQQIGKIVEFIDGVADKADLLALNAELEGTKAGEVGRGFSLVAAEMRRLAEGVMTSTREISRLIEEIRDATHAAVMSTEAGVKATDAGAATSQRVSENLRAILELARQTSEAVRAISLGTHQQQTGTDQLAEAMTDILRSTQAGAAATRQITAANVDLSALATDLKRVVERFRVS